MEKVRVITLKEWGEVFRHRLVLFTVIFLPLLFAGIALVTVFTTRGVEIDDASIAELTNELNLAECSEGEGGACFQLYLATQFLLMFMLVPVIIPVTIASYSVVGEKTTRSLEPLLATPITTSELIAGKALAAVIPAILGTWLGFLIYLVGVMIAQPALLPGLLNGFWLFAIFVVGPLLSLLAVSFALMISSRVTDPRAAEQLSTVVILPLILIIVGQSIGLFTIDQQAVFIFAGILVILDIGLLYLASQVFQRENILVKWK